MTGASAEGVLDAVIGDPAVDAQVDGTAMVAAMLRFEAELAAAAASVGLVPAQTAHEIAEAAATADIKPGALAQRSLISGSPVVSLVEIFAADLSPDAQRWVHHGATTQDVLDTALMCVAADVIAIVLPALVTAATRCAELAEAEAGTLMVARTLGQHAQPTSFGLKTAGWCLGLWQTHSELTAARSDLAIQLGGAAGTRASLGAHAVPITRLMAARLGLTVSPLPWHTERSRVRRLSAALAGAVATWSKIATDVAVLAQTEIGELREDVPGGGRSSAMPHKRNPAAAVSIRAAALRAPGLLATIYAASAQENERGVGGWQAEWVPLRELLRLAGAVAVRGAGLLASLAPDRARMLENLDLTRGLTMSEALAAALAPQLGRLASQDLARDLARIAANAHASLADVATADERVASILDPAAVAAAVDPRSVLGSVRDLIAEALREHRRRAGEVAQA